MPTLIATDRGTVAARAWLKTLVSNSAPAYEQIAELYALCGGAVPQSLDRLFRCSRCGVANSRKDWISANESCPFCRRRSALGPEAI